MTGNEYAAETDWSKEQDKGKVSKGRNTKCQNRSIQISSLNDTREKILPALFASVIRLAYTNARVGRRLAFMFTKFERQMRQTARGARVINDQARDCII